MKKRNFWAFAGLIILASASLITCGNPIIEKWWGETEPEIWAFYKDIPVVEYKSLIDHEIVYETIYETVYETIYLPSPPEIVYEIVKEYVYIELPPEIVYETIIEYAEVEVVKEVIKEIIKEVEKIVISPPTEEEILIYIKENPEIIIQIIKDTEYIYETIREYVIKTLTEEELIEIIKKLPPEIIYEYLTEEQIKYIIKQQPPTKILQSIKIINIEYVIFAGESSEFNGLPGPGGSSALTAQMKTTNNKIVDDAVKVLKTDPEVMLLLHGHANPVLHTAQETAELIELSTNRAKSVSAEVKDRMPGIDLSGRMDVKGYAGEGNISASTSNVELNRRVEVIIFKIDTTTLIGE